jgi:hypothetical protein
MRKNILPSKERVGSLGLCAQSKRVPDNGPFSGTAQLVLFPGLDGRRCQVCDLLISNINLGGSEKRSAVNGRLWCLTCADLPAYLQKRFGAKSVERRVCRNQKTKNKN